MQDYLVLFSGKLEKEDNIRDVLAKINSFSTETPSGIIFFSDLDSFEYYTKEFYKNFPQSQIIGSTTYVNFTAFGIQSDGLSVLVFYSAFECSSGTLSEVGRRPIIYSKNICSALNKLSTTQNTLCLEFTNAFTNGEDLVMDSLMNVLDGTGIPIVGSSSGNDLKTTQNAISLNGKVYQDSCVFMFIHNTKGRIVLYKENIYKPTRKYFTVTGVDCDKRKVYEYDGMPAAQIIARTLNIKTSDLGEYFLDHPMGRLYGDDCYLMEGNEVLEDGSITYFSRVYNHTRVALLEAEPIESVWQKTREEIALMTLKPRFMISINCLARTILFEKENITDKFIENLGQICKDFIGISGYGEQMNGIHFNQTMVLVLFE